MGSRSRWDPRRSARRRPLRPRSAPPARSRPRSTGPDGRRSPIPRGKARRRSRVRRDAAPAARAARRGKASRPPGPRPRRSQRSHLLGRRQLDHRGDPFDDRDRLGGRASRRRPSLKVLDEGAQLGQQRHLAESGGITETQINDAVLKTGKKQTILIISHRLSTVLSADKIIVLENGTIVETGRHAELLENNNGVYARLFGREAEIGEETISYSGIQAR